MTKDGEKTAGQREHICFLLQLLTELCEIFWNISDCSGVDHCIVTGLIIPSLQTCI
jgi:hypothetical protein